MFSSGKQSNALEYLSSEPLSAVLDEAGLKGYDEEQSSINKLEKCLQVLVVTASIPICFGNPYRRHPAALKEPGERWR